MSGGFALPGEMQACARLAGGIINGAEGSASRA